MPLVNMKGIEPEDLFARVAEAMKDPEKLKKLDQLPTDAYQRTLRGVRNFALAMGIELNEAEAAVQVAVDPSASKEEMDAAVKRGISGIAPASRPARS